MVRTELRKVGRTGRTSQGGTSSASGGWRRGVEQEPTEGAVPRSALGCRAGRGGESTGTPRACAHEISLQGTIPLSGAVCVVLQLKISS